MKKNLFEIYEPPKLQNPTLIVGWQTHNIGRIGSQVIDFLKEKLGGHKISRIRPLGFFPFRGVEFKDDVIQVPESEFWACEDNNLLLFESDEPEFEWYEFLNAVLDIAEHHYMAKELYTVSGTVSFIAHTTPRRILTVFNQPKLKRKLLSYGFEEMDYTGEPAISTYLLWIAKKRGFTGISLWPEVPFYLATTTDLVAIKSVLSFLNRKFNLDMDFGELDFEIEKQDAMIAQLRQDYPEIDESIRMLEKGLPLNEGKQLRLAKEVYDFLERGT